SACTSCLIEWCKANDEAWIKLFSDSAKDAKDEGRPRQQMSTQKTNYLQQLAAAIFTDDEDPNIHALYKEHPLSFIKPINSQFNSLKKRYNSINKELGQTGAGLKSIEELDADPRTKTLVG
ncbi:uncharacterized protein EDB91DRAFT_1026207, partial [Suillus paluster]|uniref:uncharacterized protein n=1 Tax=Suillus paluster TaxID=48578 RepID=UPI001B879194